MRQFIGAFALLALAVPVSRADEKDDAAKKLNGTYEVVSIFVGGKLDDSKKDELKSFVIKDGTLTVKTGKRDEEAKFTVDPSKKPAQMDITAGKDGKETALGIYETKETDKGLELTIAFVKGDPNATRPKDFKGEGKEEIVFKLLRKKDKDK